MMLAAAALIAVACAQDKPAPAKGHGCPMGGQQQKGLGLSAEQTKKVRALQADFKTKTEKLTPTLRTKSKALETLNSAKKPDKAKIAAATAEVGKLRTELKKRQQEYRAAVTKLLTPEQKKKLAGPDACPASADPALCPSPGECALCDGQCAHHGKDNGSGRLFDDARRWRRLRHDEGPRLRLRHGRHGLARQVDLLVPCRRGPAGNQAPTESTFSSRCLRFLR